ncbi:MAG: DUF3891 family protein [Verrucomicrobia bacterium]|nr:DUF3891 family protein [Verrucomicrobiota bacterium]
MIIQAEQPSRRHVAISQPAHSWVSGQLARVWGNVSFSHFDPFEQICYAAEQHDVGFLRWETAPTLNKETGLPHSFEELPEDVHFEIWRTGIFQLRAICPYASLIVSLHFCNLCERFHNRPAEGDQSGPVTFLNEQREYQQAVRSSLQKDPLLQRTLENSVLAYHRDLLAAWDYLSLELCRGRSSYFKVPAPTSKETNTEIRVRKVEELPNVWELDPWPFKDRSVTAVCEARKIPGRFHSAETMRAALLEAERFSLHFQLRPFATI